MAVGWNPDKLSRIFQSWKGNLKYFWFC